MDRRQWRRSLVSQAQGRDLNMPRKVPKPIGGPLPKPKMLVLDMSYTLQTIRARGLEDSVTCRDLDGFFSRVWTVHPFASLLTSSDWAARYGAPISYKINRRHVFIEGKVGRWSWLRRLAPLNFAIAQFSVFAALVRLIRSEGISVIRVGDPHYLGLLGLGLGWLCHIPVVVRVGGNYDLNRRTSGKPIHPRLFRSAKIEKWIEQFVFQRVSLVAGANQDNLNYALANGASSDRSTLFRYGNLIDRRHFVEPRKREVDRNRFGELGIRPGHFLLTVARLESTNSLKHPEDVVWILAQLRAKGHEIKAVLVGEGRLQGSLTNLARELGLAEHLIFAGSRDQDWLAQMYAAAAVVVSPHAGRALSEAALAGAPVVGYDIDWQRELIENEVTGLLIPHRDVEQMGRGVARLLDDRSYARRLGAALRDRALDMLNPERLNAHERATYARLLKLRQ